MEASDRSNVQWHVLGDQGHNSTDLCLGEGNGAILRTGRQTIWLELHYSKEWYSDGIWPGDTLGFNSVFEALFGAASPFSTITRATSGSGASFVNGCGLKWSILRRLPGKFITHEWSESSYISSLMYQWWEIRSCIVCCLNHRGVIKGCRQYFRQRRPITSWRKGCCFVLGVMFESIRWKWSLIISVSCTSFVVSSCNAFQWSVKMYEKRYFQYNWMFGRSYQKAAFICPWLRSWLLVQLMGPSKFIVDQKNGVRNIIPQWDCLTR